MKVLVTGASGFVGAEIVRALTASGARPIAAVRRSVERLPVEVERLQLDLEDISSIHAALQTAQPDAIVHAAAYGAVVSVERDAVRMVNVNLRGTLAIHAAAAALGVQRFVHLGSAVEYGASPEALDEDAPLRPRGPYGATKAAAYLALSAQGHSHPPPAVTLRLFNLFGPNDDPSRLGGQMIRAAREGTKVSLTAGTQRRDFSFVRDVATRIVAVTTLPIEHYPAGRTFNVASGEALPVREFALRLAKALGVETLLELGTYTERKDAPSDMFANVARLTALLEIAGRADALRSTPFEEAARACVDG